MMYRVEFRELGRKKWRVLSCENWAGDDAVYFKRREDAELYRDRMNDPDYYWPWEWRPLNEATEG